MERENGKKSGLDRMAMYFNPQVAKGFAQAEQNEKNFRVAAIVDRILMQVTQDMPGPLFVAELGGGAHPDRYHRFFERLLTSPGGHMDWVDISPHMLALASEYLQGEQYEARKGIIHFVESDLLDYVDRLAPESLDMAIMKYTLDHLDSDEVELFFQLLQQKLKPGGKLVSTMAYLDGKLRSVSTNARFLYHGQEFPDDEVKQLQGGDDFTVKFLKVSGHPEQGYIEGAETTKYYHSAGKIHSLALQFGFDVYVGDWKGYLTSDQYADENLNQDVLVLTKK